MTFSVSTDQKTHGSDHITVIKSQIGSFFRSAKKKKRWEANITLLSDYYLKNILHTFTSDKNAVPLLEKIK